MYTYTCTYSNTHAHTYTYTHSHTHTHTYTHSHTRTHTHIHIHIHIHTHIHIHVHIPIHSYTHAHTHTHILIVTQVHDILCKISDSESACVLIFNADSQTFVSSEDGSISGAGSLLRAPLADGRRSIALATAEARLPVHVSDLAGDQRYNADVDIEASLEARACLLSVPILAERDHSVLGVVQVRAHPCMYAYMYVCRFENARQTSVLAIGACVLTFGAGFAYCCCRFSRRGGQALTESGSALHMHAARIPRFMHANTNTIHAHRDCENLEHVSSALGRAIQLRLESEKRVVKFGDFSREVAEKMVVAIGGSYSPAVAALVLEQQIKNMIKCQVKAMYVCVSLCVCVCLCVQQLGSVMYITGMCACVVYTPLARFSGRNCVYTYMHTHRNTHIWLHTYIVHAQMFRYIKGMHTRMYVHAQMRTWTHECVHR